MILDFTKTWLVEEMVETNLVLTIHGTNWWLVNPTNSSLGDIYSRLWVGKDTNGIATEPFEETVYYQNAISPFLGKGNLTNVMGWSRLAGVSAEMELVIAGDPAFTNDVVVKFTITATDKDTGEAIPDADITVGGASVTNGFAWQSYKEHTTNDVTPTITGHANWTAELSASVIRLELTAEPFAFFTTDTNPPPLLAAMAAAAPATNTVVLADDLRITGTVSDARLEKMANTTNQTKIGSRIVLIMKATNEESVLSGFGWQIEGDPLQDFVKEDYDRLIVETNGVTVTTNLVRDMRGFRVAVVKTNQLVKLHWWKPGTYTVTASCKLMGKPQTATCKFVVEAPAATASILTVGVGNVSVVTNADGIAFVEIGTGPGAVWLEGNEARNGQLGWTQIVPSGVRTTTFADGTTLKINSSGVEGNDHPTKIGWSFKDFPAAQIHAGATKIEFRDSFDLYRVYLPNGPGLWVPVMQYKWTINLDATLVNGTWQFSTNNIGPPVEVNPILQMPAWDRKLKPLVLPPAP